MGFLDDITGTWDYGELPANITVGAGCFLERKDSFERFRSTRTPGLVLGDRVTVYTWTTFNVDPTGVVEVADDCVLVGGVFMCTERITIGRRVVVSYNVTLADSDFHPADPDERRRDAIASAPESTAARPSFRTAPIVIDDDVHIGIGAIVLKGVRVGAGARIGAGAVVTRDVPSGATVTGNPAVVTGP